ncbi:WHG domain-containing protein [Actinoallomurus sp. NPDC052274]|uniref:TetR/AcrR family transcriptional regulator n=1 Tax=Actinoallomurus sp. NPDC052274 TaxID=3155420 RepID=UPI00343E13D9
MSPREPTAEAHPRGRLLEAAIRILAADGPEALQTRRLATEVGMSTMAVYTHFGGMGGLITEIVREGFIRLGRRMEEIPAGDDPVVDLLALGLAYRDHALDNPQLYRLMFGVIPPGGRQGGKDLTVSSVGNDLPEGQAAFARLVTAVTRVMEAAGTREEEPHSAAAQFWSAIHGYVLLEIAGFFDGDGDPVERYLVPLGTKLVVGIGAAPEHTARCVRLIAAARPSPETATET